ncbi:hypothetical protein [Acidovorax facilis]|uniref:hypothetical protein n=1 Tax=Acidovorax facilis TaxID=12917 RepID=UPI003D65A430
MLEIRRSGNMADVIASVRDVPARIVPYAASTALTRTAQHAAKIELPAEMRSVFGNPVAYTLNSLRIEPATKDTLSARVMVKTSAAGIAPENFLLPQVEGGGRKHKRAEAAMRYAGVLGAGQFAMPGKGLSLDANGNVKGAEVRTILAALKNIRAVSNAEFKQRKGRKLENDLFVGKPNGGNRPDGIWRREGKRIRALFVFTNDAPTYGKRLDFTGVVQRVALQRFQPEFQKAMAAMVARGGRA